jgi:hypothetical protein
MSFSIINTLMYVYYYIVYSFFRLGFRIGFFVQDKKESFLDLDTKYILPLKTKFVKTFENQTIQYNENIDPIFYDKKEFSTCVSESNNRLETTWKTKMLFENTPRGNILMFYDAYKLGFSFYSDQNVISYDILNAAAMKYVSIFRCRDFFIDESITPTSSPFIKLHFTEEPKKEISKSEKSAFVKLQNYSKENPNKKHPKNAATSILANLFSFEKPNQKQKMVETNEPEKMKNKFLYLGKMNNFKIIQMAPKKRKVLAKFTSPLLDNIQLDSNIQRERISYSDFKKSMQKMNQEPNQSSDS